MKFDITQDTGSNLTIDLGDDYVAYVNLSAARLRIESRGRWVAGGKILEVDREIVLRELKKGLHIFLADCIWGNAYAGPPWYGQTRREAYPYATHGSIGLIDDAGAHEFERYWLQLYGKYPRRLIKTIGSSAQWRPNSWNGKASYNGGRGLHNFSGTLFGLEARLRVWETREGRVVYQGVLFRRHDRAYFETQPDADAPYVIDELLEEAALLTPHARIRPQRHGTTPRRFP